MEEQAALEAIASAPKTVHPNTDLTREGARVDSLFVLTSGWAYRYATTREGGRQISAILVPGDVANLDSLMIDRLDYGVRTVSPATFVAMPRDQSLALSAQHVGIGRAFTRLALLENSILSKWNLCLGRRSSKQRVAHLLCELSVRLRAERENESSFAFPMTQEQLGDVLGLTSIHVNRTLMLLKEEELFATANRVVSLPDLAGLRRVAGFDPRYLHLS